METDNFPPIAFLSGYIVGTAVQRQLDCFLFSSELATNNNTGQNMREQIEAAPVCRRVGWYLLGKKETWDEAEHFAFG